MEKLKVRYVNPKSEPLAPIEKGDWVDLRCRVTTELHKGEYRVLPLGIAVELPKYFEAWVLPRSSTFRRWGLVMVNGMGVIDGSYNGDHDEWCFPALATRDVVIHEGDRIAQFRIMPNQPTLDIVTVDHLGNGDRGGLGTTGAR